MSTKYPYYFHTLPDGRKLAYAVFGAIPQTCALMPKFVNGVPELSHVEPDAASPTSLIVYLHGFPSSRMEARFFSLAAKAKNATIIALDRPGFGRSDTDPNHSIDEFVRSDLRHFVDGVGSKLFNIDNVPNFDWVTANPKLKFGVLGISGGGPYTCSVLRQWKLQSEINGIKLPKLHSIGLVSALPPGLGVPGSFSKLPWISQLTLGMFSYLPKSWLSSVSLWQRSIILKLAQEYINADDDLNYEKRDQIAKQLKNYMAPVDYEVLESVPERNSTDTNTSKLEDKENFMRMYMEMTLDFALSSDKDYAMTFTSVSKLYFDDTNKFAVSVDDGGYNTRVDIYQGGLDFNVPKSLGVLLHGQITGSHYHFSENDAHVSTVINNRNLILDRLLL
ncbi:hypothetical protein HK096_006797 [Nowakowskiella sp. JEL0078]|nr:hypothetical protein HK096_006797 [Nowakowskiella sp. JEL0078]